MRLLISRFEENHRQPPFPSPNLIGYIPPFLVSHHLLLGWFLRIAGSWLEVNVTQIEIRAVLRVLNWLMPPLPVKTPKCIVLNVMGKYHPRAPLSGFTFFELHAFNVGVS